MLLLLGEQRSQKSQRELLLIHKKAGLVVFCGSMITLMYKHGGVHEWDLTAAQVHTVSYVRTALFDLIIIKLLTRLRSGLMSEQ